MTKEPDPASEAQADQDLKEREAWLIRELQQFAISQRTAEELARKRVREIKASGLDWRFWLEEFDERAQELLDESAMLCSIYIRTGKERML